MSIGHIRFFQDDNNPENVCIGSFSMHHLQQSCKFGSIDATTCSSDPDNPASADDITLAHELDTTTVPTFAELKDPLRMLEQMLITYNLHQVKSLNHYP